MPTAALTEDDNRKLLEVFLRDLFQGNLQTAFILADFLGDHPELGEEYRSDFPFDEVLLQQLTALRGGGNAKQVWEILLNQWFNGSPGNAFIEAMVETFRSVTTNIYVYELVRYTPLEEISYGMNQFFFYEEEADYLAQDYSDSIDRAEGYYGTRQLQMSSLRGYFFAIMLRDIWRSGQLWDLVDVNQL